MHALERTLAFSIGVLAVIWVGRRVGPLAQSAASISGVRGHLTASHDLNSAHEKLRHPGKAGTKASADRSLDVQPGVDASSGGGSFSRVVADAEAVDGDANAPHSTPRHARLVAAIAAVDQTGSGSVELQQLELLMQLVGANPTKREVRELQDSLIEDFARMGKPQAITPALLRMVLDRFYGMPGHSPGEEHMALEQAWDVVDQNADGKVAGSELSDLTTMLTTLGEPLSEEELQELLTDMDANHDGEITRAEFFTSLT